MVDKLRAWKKLESLKTAALKNVKCSEKKVTLNKRLGIYVDKWLQDERNKMKPNYVQLVFPGQVSQKVDS